MAGARSWILGALLCACSTQSAPPEREREPSPEEPPADALEARLRERGNEVASIMMPSGEIKRGEVSEGETRDHSHIMETGYCYEIDAVGGGELRDLDLRLYDPNDVLIQRDTSEDAEPLIGRDRQICPPSTGTYRIQVRAERGSGPYALQAYRTL